MEATLLAYIVVDRTLADAQNGVWKGEYHAGREGNSKRMLNMKVDPTMSMTTQEMTTNFPLMLQTNTRNCR